MSMNKPSRNKKACSLTNLVLIRISLLIAVLLATLILGYSYVISVVEENHITAAKNTLSIYRNRIENTLGNITEPLAEIFVRYSEIGGLTSDDSNQVYYSAKQMSDVLQSKIIYSDAADGFFVVNQSNAHVLTSFSERMSGMDRYYCNQFLKNQGLETTPALTDWIICQIGECNYFCIYCSSGTVVVGALVSAETLLNCVEEAYLSDECAFFLTDQQGSSLASVGTDPDLFFPGDALLENGSAVTKRWNNKYFLVTIDIPALQARLTNAAVRQNVLKGISVVQWSVIALVLFSLNILIWTLFFLRKEVLTPLAALEQAAARISVGIWDQPVEYAARTRELQTLRDSFNEMTSEIRNLKIQSYEDEISHQKIELRYLQLQIRPHFYLNALTTIHSMTFLNRNEQIRCFIEALSNHMRYTIRNDVARVTVIEEMNHIEDYLSMQKIRFENNVFYLSDVAPDTRELEIPQFLILTFVENIFKHAVMPDAMLSVMVKVRREPHLQGGLLRITIEDNGPGFPEKLLGTLDPTQDPGQQHIGICNVWKTIKLYYGDSAQIRLSNSCPTGAHIEIELPLKGDEYHAPADRG